MSENSQKIIFYKLLRFKLNYVLLKNIDITKKHLTK